MIENLTIGIFSLQGNVSEHVAAMQRAMTYYKRRGEVITIKDADSLMRSDGVVIPGGESTTISRLLVNFGLQEPLKDRIMGDKLPVFGTCAGMVLLADEGDEQVERSDTHLLELMKARVIRNAFGSQKNSFEALVNLSGHEVLFPGVFIRAPAYISVGPEVEVLGQIEEKIILAKYENILASSFHPELTPDPRVHGIFLDMLD